LIKKWGQGGAEIVVASALFFLSLFLPWVDIVFGSSIGFSTDGIFVLLLFAYPLYVILAKKPMYKIAGMVCGIAAIVAMIYFYSLVNTPLGNFAGSGLYIAFISSILLLVGIYIKNKEAK